jgi:glycosyltransferase involved in cell wall biosynthesis
LPGVIYEEAIKFSEDIDKVYVIVFHSTFSTTSLSKKIIVHSVPLKFEENITILSLSVILNFFILTPLLIWIILKNKINLIRADDIVLTGLPAIVAGKITGRHVIIFIAGSLEETLHNKLIRLGAKKTTIDLVLRFSRELERLVIRHSDFVFAVTSNLTQRVRNYGAQKTLWTPSFVNFSLFKPINNQKRPKKTFKVLFVGRLEPEKGVNILIDAAHILRGKNIEFIIVGDGTLRRKIEEAITRLNLKNLKLLGSKPHTEMPKIYNQADVFVLPSFTEGAPVSMLEAMACGLPTIVTPVGIIPELMVNRIHALIIPKGDAKALATAINQLFEDEELKEKIQRNGRELILKKFSGYVERHLKVYKNLVSAR